MNKPPALLLCLVVFACSGSGDDTEPPADAGTAPCLEPKFTSIYFDLLSSGSSCAAPGCHDSATASGNLDFGSGKELAYMALGRTTANVDAQAMYPDRVVAGQPGRSFLYAKVSTATITGGRMPLSRPPLEACNVQAIEQWITNGANDD